MNLTANRLANESQDGARSTTAGVQKKVTVFLETSLLLFINSHGLLSTKCLFAPLVTVSRFSLKRKTPVEGPEYNGDVKKLSLHFIIVFLVSLYFASDIWAAEKIRFGLNASHSPPLLYKFENQNMPIATGGFLYDNSVALAEELKEDYSLVIIPRGRVPQELTSGNIDLICHSSTHWNTPYQNRVSWSKPLYTYTKVLVAKTDIPFTRIDQIKNVTIGTVEDFVYSDLAKRFENKTLFRDDATSIAVNISKLLGGRVDYIVMNELEFPYHKAANPQLKRSSFVLDKMDIRCALSQKSSLSLQKLNGAIDRLKKRQVLQKIYELYSNPRTIPAPLVYGLNNNDSPPFIFFDKTLENPTIKGGVFFDLALEVGKHIHRPLIFALLPRSRLDSDLAEGKVDIVCYDTEAWAGKYAKNYFWSMPIFQQSNYIVSLKSLTEDVNIKSLKELHGKTLGTTLHFVYPTLDPYFKNGTMIREDADSGLANMTKLNLKRVNYIVLNNLEYTYYKKTSPLLQKAPIDIDPIDVKCAISKKSNLKISQLNAAIITMKKNGRLEKVFAQETP